MQPILYPAVADGSARLRFFLSCQHQEDRIRHAVTETATAIRNAGQLDYRALMSKVAGWDG